MTFYTWFSFFQSDTQRFM